MRLCSSNKAVRAFMPMSKALKQNCLPVAFIRSSTLLQQRNFISCRPSISSSVNITKNVQMYQNKKSLSTLPSHILVPMPALSPTMESGSIAKWLMKEGEKFQPGQAICEVETDKASVTYEATDEGYIAKILAGTGEIKVGSPMMITVTDEADLAAFTNYTSPATTTTTTSTPSKTPSPSPTPSIPIPVNTTTTTTTPPPSPTTSTSTPSPSSTPSSGRVFASPLARRLASESGIPINVLSPGSGPYGRIIAADVAQAILSPPVIQTTPVATTPVATTASTSTATSTSTGVISGRYSGGAEGAFNDFEISPVSQAIAARLTAAKQNIPHYYLTVELNLTNLMELRSKLNVNLSKEKNSVSISVLDMVLKASALAVRQVPDVNASWFEEGFVRRYDKVRYCSMNQKY
eukprot:gene1287-2485_t